MLYFLSSDLDLLHIHVDQIKPGASYDASSKANNADNTCGNFLNRMCGC